MRRRSDKAAAIYREWKRKRIDYLDETGCCDVRSSVCTGTPHDVHEIVGGPVRLAAFVNRYCWLRTCRSCHDYLQGYSKALQMALKLLADPNHFSIVEVCKVWGRAATAIDPGDVLNELQMLLIKRNT